MRIVAIDHYGLCETCHGDGCRECGGKGEVPTVITAPADEVVHLYPWADVDALPTARPEQEARR